MMGMENTILDRISFGNVRELVMDSYDRDPATSPNLDDGW
jgi:hypothetical protein